MPNLWIYKCNANDEGNHGDWTEFFSNRGGQGRWGGGWCIKNPGSRKILFEELQIGDFILAWQTDERAAMGLCRVTDLPGEGDDMEIKLETVKRFRPPVRLLSWKRNSSALANGKGFIQGKLGTLFETTEEEASEIMRICNVPV